MMEIEANEQARIRDASCYGSYSEPLQWHLPILAMTADVIQATYEECLKCGMDGYVSKPFDEEQLSQAVAKLVASKSISDL